MNEIEKNEKVPIRSQTPQSTQHNKPRNRFLKYTSLLVLTIQTSFTAILLRYTRVSKVEGVSDIYIASTAVFFTEVLKFLVSCIGLFIESNLSFEKLKSSFENKVFGNTKDLFRIMIPASLYSIQNNLLYIALSNLDPVTFQVLNQTKIITTAFFSWVVLNKKIRQHQGLALVMLTFGVILVQMSDSTTTPKKLEGVEGVGVELAPTQNKLLGLFVILGASISSGFSSCYLEKSMKANNSSMWVRNIQLAMFGSFFSYLVVAFESNKSIDLIQNNGFFQGYSGFVWVSIFLQVFGGIIVAMVLKYADSILKSFATSFSIILSSVLSMAYLNFLPSIQFTGGSLLVMAAVFLYSKT